jgi:uncharacterized protein (UPF0261 family)
MPDKKNILIIGTYDTKSDELRYLQSCIERQGGSVVTMDVSVLGEPTSPVNISKHKVAEAAKSSIEKAANSGDENTAMQIMAQGASAVCSELYAAKKIDGMIAMGGTMGTDLALDCARVLPLGVPKYIISTVAFSPLIPPDRLSADIQMILWAGGLYGLNRICKSSLSQAAGAVLGAAKAVEMPKADRPVVGMTSMGSSALLYMKYLKPELEKRGFEVAIFHATGMGGMAFENLAAEGAFVAVMDFAPQELANWMFGSSVHGGKDRVRAAGRASIPQLIAPGFLDMIDFPGVHELPERFKGRPFHAHNRLIVSAVLTPAERREAAREMSKRLLEAKAPVHLILPLSGIEEWDKPGGPAHDPEGLKATLDELRATAKPPIAVTELKAHINDRAFADEALRVFDAWVANGTIRSH